jgi:hypothetical protein
MNGSRRGGGGGVRRRLGVGRAGIEAGFRPAEIVTVTTFSRHFGTFALQDSCSMGIR